MPAPNTNDIFSRAINDHLALIRELDSQQPLLRTIAETLTNAILDGHRIFWCGNGGSAADSQHLAAELVGRFRRERKAMASIALTTDTSILTAIANDYGYEFVFRRQLEALASAGDVVIGLSTSGNSKNVCAALEYARSKGIITVGLTGRGGGTMAAHADHLLSINSTDTARIQEAHTLAGHMLCDWVEIAVTDAVR